MASQKTLPSGSVFFVMDILDPKKCYRALKTHDSRFDGRFFVAVTSTKIYCRPICRVRIPKLENCRFYPNAALAESLGFRPCLRCRPELAPGLSLFESASRTIQIAIGRMDSGFLEENSLEDLATDMGITDRHLRRIFHRELGVSLTNYVQTRRLHLAKQLLTDTHLPVTEVAFASGFSSIRRFNDALKKSYRLTPTDIRKQKMGHPKSESFYFELAYRAPYPWTTLLAFLRDRAITGVEWITEDTYSRTVAIGEGQNQKTGWIVVSQISGKDALRLEISESLSRLIPAVQYRVKKLFDLACDPREIHKVLGSTLPFENGMRLPGAFDGFELAIRAILGQQVSVKAAKTLAGRVAETFGSPAMTPRAELSHIFPTAKDLAQVSVEAMQKIGVTRTRANTLVQLAKAVASEKVRLNDSGDVQGAIAALKDVPGIGEWTAQYIAMRALRWPDAFPHTDLGIMKALGTKSPKQILAISEKWRPWRAYAVMALWQSLGKENV